MNPHMHLDALVQRFQSLTRTHVLREPDGRGGESPFLYVTKDIVSILQINSHTIQHSVDTISADVYFWARAVASTKRVWQQRDREYRVWRSHQEIELRGNGTKATKDTVDSLIRVKPEYTALQIRIEEAEESHNVAVSLLDALKIKAQLLRADLYRTQDGELHRRSP